MVDRTGSRRTPGLFGGRIGGATRAAALVGGLIGGFFIRPVVAAEGDLLPSLPEGAESSLKLEIPEVELLRKQSLAPDVLTYRIAMSKGVRFYMGIKEYPAADQQAGWVGSWQFENESDEPVPMTIEFSRRNNGAGSGLLSQDRRIEIDVETEHAHPGGFATIIEAPLRDLKPDEKQLVLPETNEDPRARGPGFRRMAIIARAGVALDAPEKVFPRAELIVGHMPPERKRVEQPSPAILALRGQGQALKIGTAHIRFRRFVWPAHEFAVRDPGPVRKAFLTANLVDHPERLNSVYEELSGGKPSGNAWTVKEFYGVGVKTREKFVEGSLAGDGQLYDGEFVLRWDELNRTLHVNTAKTTRVARTTLGSFRYLPPWVLADAEVKDRRDGRMTVALGEGELVMDEATGFVRRLTSVRDGAVRLETLQLGPEEYVGGIVFPKVHIEVRYQADGKATLIEGTIVEKAEFNEPFPADTFRMSAPAGATVVDYRQDGFRPRAARLTEDVPDMAARLKQLAD